MSRQSLADLTYGFDNVAADGNGVNHNHSDDPGILPLFVESNRSKPDNFLIKRNPDCEEDIFAGHMREAQRLAAHVCMARSRASTSWLGTKGTPNEQGSVRMPENKLRIVTR